MIKKAFPVSPIYSHSFKKELASLEIEPTISVALLL